LCDARTNLKSKSLTTNVCATYSEFAFVGQCVLHAENTIVSRAICIRNGSLDTLRFVVRAEASAHEFYASKEDRDSSDFVVPGCAIPGFSTRAMDTI
jgi:hypothetical protein